MNVEFTHSQKVAVVSPRGEQDLATAHELREALDGACAATELVILDFRYVTFADSSILGLIVRAAKKCAAGGSRLMIINAHGIVDRAIRLTGLNMYYPEPNDGGPPYLQGILNHG